MIGRTIPLALALAVLTAGPALAQPQVDMGFGTWSEGAYVYDGVQGAGGSPAAYHVQVGPVGILVPEALVWSGQLTSAEQEIGALKGIETTCVVCDGPCDPPALNNAVGWGTRIDSLDAYQEQGVSAGNMSYSGGPWILDVYMNGTNTVVVPAEVATHYWCGNFLRGIPPNASSLDRVLPDYGTSLPPWARLGPSGSTVQSGVLPFK